MKLCWKEVNSLQVVIADLDTRWIGVFIQRGLNRETGIRGRIAN